MTTEEAIKSYTRAELESMVVQREVQLKKALEEVEELKRQVDGMKSADNDNATRAQHSVG